MKKKATSKKPATRRSRATKRSGSSKAVSQSVRDPRPPSHVVVFRRPSERNLALLSKVLKAKTVPSASVRSSCAVLTAKSGKAPAPRVYHRLGVAVADLSDSEVNEITSSSDVAFVAKNELRTIPPFRKGAAGSSHISASPGTEPLIAYLDGMRATVDAVQRFVTGDTAAPSSAPSRAGIQGAFPLGAPVRDLDTPDHSWSLRQVGIEPTYSKATGRGVKVAVLDTGIDLSHPDFTIDESTQTASFIPGEGVQDGNGHGTHCCGVVAGPCTSVGGKRYGVAPDAELLVGKVLSNAGSGFDDQILDGIDWAADQGAGVISMSLGAARGLGEPFANAYEIVAESLLMNEGIVIVAAAGNSSFRPVFTAPVENPSAAPSIMAIAANDQDRRVATFSCQQKDSIGLLNVSCPGVDVYSSFTGGGFKNLDGTSMATPHVAGLAALYLELEPDMTGPVLKSKLEASAISLGPHEDFGFGLAQAP